MELACDMYGLGRQTDAYSMDRKLTDNERKKIALRRLLKTGVPVLVVFIIIGGLIFIFGDTSAKAKDLDFCTADTGDIETSVEAEGKVMAAYEETLVSPVSSRLRAIYCQEGDVVEEGTPLLGLDLQSVETDIQKMRDEIRMKQNATERLALSNKNQLSNLAMKIKTKEMAVAELAAEVANEKRLDSIGSGTGDRVRQAQLTYNTALLELDQMRKELANETQMAQSNYNTSKLEESIAQRNIETLEHTLDDARIRAPHAGTVTFINSEIGATVSAGEKLAVIADLTRFKITAELPESDRAKVAAGAPATIVIAGKKLRGKITNLNPASTNGMVTFTIRPDNESDPALRAGLRAVANVVYDIIPNTVRIKNQAYYHGPGKYQLFVKTGDNTLEKREVYLGDSSFDYVAVKSGLKPGDVVAIGDMRDYARNTKIKIQK